MNILLVNPQYPDTYWSFKHALKFISKKASNILQGPLNVATRRFGPLAVARAAIWILAYWKTPQPMQKS
jgi:hypothetical protein